MISETLPTVYPATPTNQEHERLGIISLIWNVIVDPRKAFAGVGSGTLWLVLWFAFSAVNVLVNYPIRDVLTDEAISQMEQSLSANDRMTTEQKSEMIEGTRKWMQSWLAWVVNGLSHLAALFVVAAVLLFVANIMLGGNGTFIRMLNAYSLLFVISAIGVTVKAILIYVRGSADIQLGLGILQSDTTGAFVKAVAGAFTVFSIWQLWLSSEAVSVIGRLPLRRSFPAVTVVWIVFVLMMGGLAVLGTSMAS